MPRMVRNERVKLFASFLSALAIGLIAIGVLRPAFGTGGGPRWLLVRALAGLALHGLAPYGLGFMRQAMNMTLFNNLVSLAALAVAGVGILIFHLTDRKSSCRR